MNDGVVRYLFKFEDRNMVFDVETSRRSRDVERLGDAEAGAARLPAWAKLEHQQCACCPLKVSDCEYCPAAVRIAGLMDAFPREHSTERVQVTVEVPERSYHAECDLQVGINSLMGLMMSTSACPVLNQLGAMASFHIPFCSIRETLHRTVGSYLTQQYFRQQEGGEPDWELVQLKELYKQLEGLNQDFSKRIQGVSGGDALSNAVIMFLATSVVAASSLSQQLQPHKGFLTNQA